MKKQQHNAALKQTQLEYKEQLEWWLNKCDNLQTKKAEQVQLHKETLTKVMEKHKQHEVYLLFILSFYFVHPVYLLLIVSFVHEDCGTAKTHF